RPRLYRREDQRLARPSPRDRGEIRHQHDRGIRRQNPRAGLGAKCLVLMWGGLRPPFHSYVNTSPARTSCAPASMRTGRPTQNVAPSPITLRTPIDPPNSVVSSFDIASPSPVPACPRVPAPS